MKCNKHDTDATAICVHCGLALCSDCRRKSPSQRVVCSQECADAILRNEQADALTLSRATKGHTVSAFFCFLMGVIFIVFAALATGFGIWPLGAYLGTMGIGFVIGGFAYRRAGRKNEA